MPQSINVLKETFVETRYKNLPLVSGDILSNLTAVDSVVHEKELDISLIGDKEFLETIWEDVSSLMVLFVTNEHLLWLSTSESSSGGAIDTSDSSV